MTRLTFLASSWSWVTMTMVRPDSAVDGAQHIEDGAAGFLVDGAGGLVGQQKARVVGQRDGDGDSLLLAAGQRGQAAVFAVAHVHHVQKLQRALAAPVLAAEQHGHHHVLGRREVGKQVAGVVLPHEAHRAQLVFHQLALA